MFLFSVGDVISACYLIFFSFRTSKILERCKYLDIGC
jgi:hypothetical protein